jgi:hypothetical protein
VAALRRCGFRDTYEAVHGTLDPCGTFHGFRGRDYQGRVGKMDWVMVRGDCAVRAAEIVTDSENGRYPTATRTSPTVTVSTPAIFGGLSGSRSTVRPSSTPIGMLICRKATTYVTFLAKPMAIRTSV